MDRLKTLGTWVLLVIAFYIFSQIMTYLFLYDGEDEKNNTENTQITSENVQTDESTNNVSENRLKILN